MNKSSLIIILIILFSISLSGEELKIKSFVHEDMNLSARVERKNDLNGNGCALLIVELPVEKCGFSGNVVGIPEFRINEYWVYLTEGTKRIQVKCPGRETLDVNLTDESGNGLQSLATYRLKIEGYGEQDRADASSGPKGDYFILQLTPAVPALIKIDGVAQRTNDGQIMKFLLYGNHSFTVEAEGFESYTGNVTIDTEGSKNLNVKLVNILGKLIIKSETPDATIKLDGTDISSGTETDVLPGSYLIEVSKPGYKSYSTMVKVDEKETKRIEIPELKPLYGTLDICMTPIGSGVKIDGIAKGNTPQIIRDLLIGEHIVEISKEGYEDYREKLLIKEKDIYKLEGSLKKEDDSSSKKSHKSNIKKNVSEGNFDDYFLKGKTSFTQYDKMFSAKVQNQLKSDADNIRMGQLLIEGFEYMDTALQIGEQPSSKVNVKQKHIKEIYKIIGTHIGDLISEGINLYNLGKFKEAYQAWMMFVDIENEPKLYGLKPENLYPDSIIGTFVQNAGLAAYKAKDYNLATETYLKAAKKGYDTENIFRYGLSTAVLAKNQDAIYYFATQGVAKYGYSEPFYINSLINYYIQNEKYDEGFSFIDTALRKDSTNTNLYVLKGILYDKTGNLQDAGELYKQALKIEPENGFVNFQYGNCLYRQADKKDNEFQGSPSKYAAFKQREIVPLYLEAIKYLENAYNYDIDNKSKVLEILDELYSKTNNSNGRDSVRKRRNAM